MQEIPITIDNNSGIPLWLQLRNRLVYLITSGHFRKGDKLPTVRNLAVELGINFNTVSKVYRDIERDGYIVSRQGAGTFASDDYTRIAGNAVDEVDLLIDEFIRECLELGVPRDDIAGLVIERLMMGSDKQTETLKPSPVEERTNDVTEKRSPVEQKENRRSRSAG